MATQDIEDGRASSEHYSNTSKRSSVDAEQEQGLLGDWKEAPGEEENISAVDRSSPRTWSKAACAAIAGALLLTLFVGITFVTGLRKAAVGRIEEALGVQTSDYILDPNWDHSAPPQRREYTWTVMEHVHNPDGIYRPMLLVNNQFPGPLIEVNEDDTIVVHVDNRAVNATSLHWHGIYQNNTPHMDGTVGITQCPIPSGGNFTYEFTVSGQSGSYWWHAHQGVQSSDGLHGPLIIHGRDEKKLQKIEYTSDRVLMVSDHYHDLSSALLWQYLKPDMENAEPVPEGALINGRSIRNCDDYPLRRCDNSTSNVGIPTLNLEPGKSHRLRIINVGAFAEFQVQIDGHELDVTEVDGTNVLPKSYHRININPAQRYSVIVNASITHTESFWLRARMITECFTDPPATLASEVRAIVRYRDQATALDLGEPTSIDWKESLAQECRDMNTSELVPAQTIAAPAKEDAFFYLRSNFEIGKYRLSRGFFDSSSWRPNPRSPTLLRSIYGITERNVAFTSATVSSPANDAAFINDAAFDKAQELVVQTTGIQTIDILISNFDDGNHPLHLHGYKYFVLAQGHGYPPLTSVGANINRETLAPLYDSLDLSNPLQRDTASVEAFGWILLRLVADNPGAWAFHCHISWHTEAGLLMQFLTRSDELASFQVPLANRELCAAAGLDRGMGPDDEDYRDLAK